MKDLSIGPYTVPYAMLEIGVSILTTYIFLLSIDKEQRREVRELYSNSLVAWLFVWKLSFILFYFDLFIQSPLSLLYFSGGKYGFLLGELTFFLYFLLFLLRTYSTKKVDFAGFLLHCYLIGYFSYELFTYFSNQPSSILVIYNAAILLLFYFWEKVEKENTGFSFLMRVSLLISIEILFAFLKGATQAALLFLLIYGLGVLGVFFIQRNLHFIKSLKRNEKMWRRR